MPVILAEEDWAKWLGEVSATNDELKALLVPFKDDALTMWPVNRQRVGNVRTRVSRWPNLRRSRRYPGVKARGCGIFGRATPNFVWLAPTRRWPTILKSS
jgi:hypothetical protein